MHVEVFDDEAAAAAAAAGLVARRARRRIQRDGRFCLGVSGGSTPALMLADLARADVDWTRVLLFQVDERVAADGHPERNLTQLRDALLQPAGVPPSSVYPMPIGAHDLASAAAGYAAQLGRMCDGVLDLVHLGLGTDGHTASLVPGDPAVDVTDADVAVAGPYQGRVRMTLTLPALNRARERLWLVGGAAKAPALQRMLAGDSSLPAARVRQDSAAVYTDRAACPGPVTG